MKATLVALLFLSLACASPRNPAAETRTPEELQQPVVMLPYDEFDVTYERGGVPLRGTLTVPHGRGAHPGVLLIGGSGALDRDASVPPHRPLRVVADALTRSGFAVLRADDRAFGRDPAAYYQSTLQDRADDALSGLRFLQSRPDVDARRLAILGHSAGGSVALIAATRCSCASALVLLSVPALVGREFVPEQTESLLNASGAPPELTRRTVSLQRELLAIAANSAADVHDRADAILSRMTEMERLQLGLTPEALASQLAVLVTPWYRSMIAFDPRPRARALAIPLLAIYGENDKVVPAANAVRMREALSSNRAATVVVLPGLNHLLQRSATGLPGEYAAIGETISPDALARITRFLSNTLDVRYFRLKVPRPCPTGNHAGC